MLAGLLSDQLKSPTGTPAPPPRFDRVASNLNLDSLADFVPPPRPLYTAESKLLVDLDEPDNVRAPEIESQKSAGPINLKPSSSRPEEHATPTGIIYKRDAAGRLRAFKAGEEHRPRDFEQKHKAHMDDLTQKSSLSLTQENSESVYEQFGIRKPVQEDYPPTATPDEETLPTQANAEFHSLHSRYASARTESTAITYQEDDPRHIRLDFNIEIAEEVDEVDGSQDASFPTPYAAPQPERTANFYEPQTPAPPVNPFIKKGSVMKGHELFGATQPSSVGRHLETPASGRPSPNIYNDFSSPPKRQRMQSSPLQPGVEVNTSPLQSSDRMMPDQSNSIDSPRVSGPRRVQSFGVGLRGAVYEPRAYMSMAESQERRRGNTMHNSDPDSDGDSDIEAVPRNRKRETALRIQRELSAVKKMPSSRPSSTPAPVEVPSTRRSAQEDECIAHCEGYDAGDTQETDDTQSQDDIIVDSQALPCGPLQTSDNPLGVEALTDVDPTSNKLSEGLDDARPSLSLQQIASSRLDTYTPTTSKVQSPLDTVPETSPVNDQASPEQIRPMGDIASFSFGGGDDNLLDELSSFTPDVAFENARRMQGNSSPVPPRMRSFRKEAPFNSAVDSPASPQPGKILANSPTPQRVHEDEPDAPAVQSAGDEIDGPIERSIPRSSRRSVGPDSSELSVLRETPEAPDGMGNAIIDHATANKGIEQEENHPPPVVPNLEQQPLAPAAEHTADGAISSVGKGKGKAVHIDALADQDHAEVLDATYSEPDNDDESSRRTTNTTTSKIRPPSKTSVSSKKKASKATSSSVVTPRQSSRGIKKTTKSSMSRVAAAASASSTPRSSPLRNIVTPDTANPANKPGKRTVQRKSGVTVLADEAPIMPTRSSKRQSLARESSEDPLTLIPSGGLGGAPSKTGLFANMAFAISYVTEKRQEEREEITQLVVENGGRVLEEGFDALFEPCKGEAVTELRLSAKSKNLGFTALISDEHSRKPKYMQALALGLPCISGRWVSACISKGRLVEWSPYLLCAGMSSVLGAVKSRVLSPYSAASARLEDVIASREQLLGDKSILFVTGKGKTESEKRKTFTFLTRALGPARFIRVGDLQQARKKLYEAEVDGEPAFDALYVDVDEKGVKRAVFGTTAASSRKRKKGSDSEESPAPKKIRVIADETVMQSLIMGHLLEE